MEETLDGANRFARVRHANPFPASAAFVRREALLAVGMFDERIDFEEDWDLWLRLLHRFGEKAFLATKRPVCYVRDSLAERHFGPRRFSVEGLPVREYFQKKYGVEPDRNETGESDQSPTPEVITSGLIASGGSIGRQISKSTGPSILAGIRFLKVIVGWSDSGLCDRLTNLLLVREIGRRQGSGGSLALALIAGLRLPVSGYI